VLFKATGGCDEFRLKFFFEKQLDQTDAAAARLSDRVRGGGEFFFPTREGECVGSTNQKKGKEGRKWVGCSKKNKRYAPPAASPRKPQENKIIRYRIRFFRISLSLQNFVSISNRRQNACFTDARKKEKKRIRAHFLRATRIETRSGEAVRTSSRRSRREEDS
jgi:hypothetical protein